MLEGIRSRLDDCGLEVHPTKTKIVYCKDDDRRGKYERIKFDFLGYTLSASTSQELVGASLL